MNKVKGAETNPHPYEYKDQIALKPFHIPSESSFH